jgi:hypothetical protein
MMDGAAKQERFRVIMEEYQEKIAKLSVEKLVGLEKVYARTIHEYEVTIREALVVGMTTIVEYNRQELEKKQAELAVIQKLITERRAR